MARALVIVESPAKAERIGQILGDEEYIVDSSVGHIRNLPNGADEVPEEYKAESWARLGVNVDEGFKPVYVISKGKKPVVANLRRLLKGADELYIATDEDREGESIAWHLLEVLAPTVPVKRMVFHEITPAAISRAVEEWRDLDRRLVDAQEARRILDRLYGYEVSPVLWRKVTGARSAGRVQSVATRMVVERERARMRFRSATWWGVDGTFTGAGAGVGAGTGFGASLVSLGGTRVATGRDFDEQGAPTGRDARVLGEEEATSVATALAGRPFSVSAVNERPYRRSPAAPFTTSTLQQEAGRKLGLSAQRAMQAAQRLYEQGYITYMRTDSTTLSEEALTAARTQARQRYGDAFVPDAPRRYTRKVKNAQEAHEAIRPAGDTFRTPDEVAGDLSGSDRRLYELVWMRTVASQMNDATGTSAQVRLVAPVPEGLAAGQEAEFSASGRVISFQGFLMAYKEGQDEDDANVEGDGDVVLPPLAVGDLLEGSAFEPGAHATQPPARYTEASLVKAMEELGVGRPSTYATVISTILDRGYVWKRGSALVPSFTAFAVVALLERYFPNLVDYGFTATMEDDLDEIAAGTEEVLPWLTRFYFGSDALGASSDGRSETDGQVDETMGLKASVATHIAEIDAREINSIPIGTGRDGRLIVARVGRYGPYLQCGEERASIPDDLPPDELTVERAEEILAAPSNDRVLGADPQSGLPVQLKAGRFGPYVQLGEATEGGEKPRTASLFSSMDPATLTLEQALDLLRIPRTVGVDPESGAEIVASNGRFGPYLKRGSETRSLASEEQLLTVTLSEAQALFAQPKQRRRRAAAPPLRELGADPATGLPVVLKEGRFGPYVTDGTTNASLRQGDSVEDIDLERASELLAERRAAPPSRTKKAATKKKATAAKKKVSTSTVRAPKKSAAPAKTSAATKKKKASTKKATATNKKATRAEPGAATDVTPF